MGELELADERVGRAAEIWEALVGPHARNTLLMRTNLGLIRLDRGDLDGACEVFETLVANLNEELPASDGARARFGLAQCSWPQKERRGRAIELAKEAEQGFREEGAPARDDLVYVQKWLREHE
jgi:hypothetical protein